MVRDSRAASIKGWETRKRREQALGYGPKGCKRGTDVHKVKSVSVILARLRSGTALASPETYIDTNHESAGSSYSPDRMNDAGGDLARKTPVAAREPETTG